MNQETKPRIAAQSARGALFQRTGWVFVTPSVLPELESFGIVQRFASSSGPYVHDVYVENGRVACSCPGWRKYAKCWHIRFVLDNSVGTGWTLGTNLVRMPTAREAAELKTPSAREQWLFGAIAIVGLEHRPGSAIRESGVVV